VGIISRRSLASAVAAMALLALPGAAAADVEPNDGITQAEGPLSGGTAYSGAISTENDRDWYSFYASSQTQLDIAITVPADSPCGIAVDLNDTDGQSIDGLYTNKGTTEHFRYTTAAGTNRFLLSFAPGCLNSKYQFTLNPAASIVSGPGRAPSQGTPEPNENESQAVGPLNGGQLYSASVDTDNDNDFFFFYSSGTEPFDVSLSTAQSCGPLAELTGPGTESVDSSARLSQNTTAHIKMTPPGAEKYVLKLSGGCAGTAYEFRVDPPSAITTSPPPGTQVTPPPPGPDTSAQCASARRSVVKWSKRVKSTKKKLNHPGSRKRKRKLRDQLGGQKRALKHAKAHVSQYC
jgi:opacity protein-like surface antigen